MNDRKVYKGVLTTKFAMNDELSLIQLVADYWDCIDQMRFDYNPKLGYRSSRFKKICNAKKPDGKWACEFRPICEKMDSFRTYIDSITLIESDENWNL